MEIYGLSHMHVCMYVYLCSSLWRSHSSTSFDTRIGYDITRIVLYFRITVAILEKNTLTLLEI